MLKETSLAALRFGLLAAYAECKHLVLTSLGLGLELGLHCVVATIEQTAVDSKSAKLGVQLQLSLVVLLVTLHQWHTT